ncbi:MAG: hypothetical protein EB072_11400 [Betaproteobacteria bacterium]|nr:hypothetical protein [Betaproteobacteria bacterium]
MNFTPTQRSAIEHISGNLQLIACAGSGKTEVVAQRVVSLLRPHTNGGAGCTPENIVAFTFTDKAAAELKERIHTRCKEQLGAITGLDSQTQSTLSPVWASCVRTQPRILQSLPAIRCWIVCPTTKRCSIKKDIWTTPES